MKTDASNQRRGIRREMSHLRIHLEHNRQSIREIQFNPGPTIYRKITERQKSNRMQKDSEEFLNRGLIHGYFTPKKFNSLSKPYEEARSSNHDERLSGPVEMKN